MKTKLTLLAGIAALFAIAASPMYEADATIVPSTGMSFGQTSTQTVPTLAPDPTTLSITFAVPTVKAGS